MRKYGADVAYERGEVTLVRCPRCKQFFQCYEKDQEYCEDCEAQTLWEAKEL